MVLAAGESSRLGRPKQLLDLAGKPLLQHVLDTAAASPLDEIVLVLGHGADEIESSMSLSSNVRVATNPDHASGQSTSLAAGLRAADPASRAAVILLGDQPGVRRVAIEAVIEAWRRSGARVVLASYGGRPAHPTLFAREVWPFLHTITGDQGARALVQEHPEWRSFAEIGGDPPDDVDTEEDYVRVRAGWPGP